MNAQMFRVVDVIEQRIDSECSIFTQRLPEVRVVAHLNSQTFESLTLLNNTTTRNIRFCKRFYKRLPEVRVGAHLNLEHSYRRRY